MKRITSHCEIWEKLITIVSLLPNGNDDDGVDGDVRTSAIACLHMCVWVFVNVFTFRFRLGSDFILCMRFSQRHPHIVSINAFYSILMTSVIIFCSVRSSFFFPFLTLLLSKLLFLFIFLQTQEIFYDDCKWKRKTYRNCSINDAYL